MTSEYIRMAVNLGLVILLIFILMFFLKKFKRHKNFNNKHIKIINIVLIGPKEKIILLEVNDITILVGSTPTQIETLHTFDKKKETKSFDEHLVEVHKFS